MRYCLPECVTFSLNIKPSSFPISTTRFYSHVEGHEPAVLIVKTMDEEVESSDLSN